MSHCQHTLSRCAMIAAVACIVAAKATTLHAQCANLPPIDGRNLPLENSCAPSALQDNKTGFLDTQPATSNGSELNALYVSNDASKLYIGITGNVSTDFENTILVFIQVTPVSNQLLTSGVTPEASNALRAMNNIQLDGTPSSTD